MPKINQITWAPSFKRAFRKRILGTPEEPLFRQKLEAFLNDPFTPALHTHKLTGSLVGLWAFSVSHDCRVVFDFVSPSKILLIDIGTHDDVY